MHLARFPRLHMAHLPTPLEPMERLTRLLGGPRLWIKRDDCTGLATGGNKTRKLEFLVAEALQQGADTLVTCGAVQSNHCRLTLAAAAKEGLRCRLVLEERVAGSYDPKASGNNFLYRLLGAERIRVVPEGADMQAALAQEAEALAREGRRAYLIPGGGSNPVGAVGYVACALEIGAQLFDMGLAIDRVVVASGSAGTQAGLVAGFEGANMGIPVVGINVSRDRPEQEALVFDLARRTAERLGVKTPLAREAVVCFGDYWRPKYSVPNRGMVAAVNLMARTEAILLDPVYTGKAVAGLIDLSRRGFFKPGENLLFVHTGGSPALYACMAPLLGEAEVAD